MSTGSLLPGTWAGGTSPGEGSRRRKTPPETSPEPLPGRKNGGSAGRARGFRRGDLPPPLQERTSRLRPLGRRYDVETSEEARPDALCGRCCAWGHIEPCCTAATPRSLCESEHKTIDHKCPVKGRMVSKGQPCAHGVAKCRNCRGPHRSRKNLCPVRREARQAARGWGSPAPPGREQKAKAPPPPEGATSRCPDNEGRGRNGD